MSRSIHSGLLLAIMVLSLGSCSGKIAGTDADPSSNKPVVEAGLPEFPSDRLQPWEELDDAGYAVELLRSGSSLNDGTEFIPGVEYFSSGGDVSGNQEAARLNGDSVPAWVMYRVSLQAEQPAVLSIDANLLGSGSRYSVGVSDYGSKRWAWHGPFQDSHVRLELARDSADDFTSTLGNTFVMVLVEPGSSLDLVGLGLNTLDLADATAPAQPLGLAAQAVNGGVELSWLPVPAADLAGYVISYGSKPFINPQAAGVKQLPYLEGSTRHLLDGLSGAVHVGIQSVDLSGNRSPLSEVVTATVEEGVVPGLSVETDTVSASLNASIGLTAGGADLYDWDLDGDGIFDLLDDATGFQLAAIPGPGIIRPLVRGHSADGTAVALGSISLLISGNTRPAVSLAADPQSGVAPLMVNFTGEAQDSEDDASALGIYWDFDGDGFFEDDTSGYETSFEYGAAGTYNPKLRVVDSSAAWAVASVAIGVTGTDPANELPTAVLNSDVTTGYAPFVVRFYADGSFDPDGEIVLYEWDFNNDGSYEQSGQSTQVTYTYPYMGWFTPVLRVTDDKGGQATASIDITLPSEWSTLGMGPDRRGLSPYAGPQTDNLLWTFPTGAQCDSSPTIGADGNIHVSGWDGLLVAVTPDGNLDWSAGIGIDAIHSSPSISGTGAICVGDDGGYVTAVSQGGFVLWQKSIGFQIWGSPAVARDGLIFANSVANFTRGLTPDGKNSITIPSLPGISSPAIGSDGTVYTEMNGTHMSAWTPQGKSKWSYDTGSNLQSGPAIGPDGTVYFGDGSGTLTALAADGSFLWSYPTGAEIHECKPSIAPDGTILIGTVGPGIGTAGSGLHAVNPDGSQRWVFTGEGGTDMSPSIDANGTCYFGGHNGTVFALDTDGNVVWSFATGGDFWGGCAISKEGRLYITSLTGVLYAFGSE
ncbi:MAG: PQQ-binding-like beta-propeller repeat protein [Planctomycetales bacterium]|nr:MAG: PQQ-binding-like beta-propeller repeat protein [Planctomycetales bacterium]